MPPTLALFLWFILLLCLLRFDPARVRVTSLRASWIPVSWMFFLGSRLPSQWLGLQSGYAAESYEDGNSLDRVIFSMLILLAIGILISRSFRWDSFFRRNIPLIAFLTFGLFSVIWSDFPLVAFKRWFKELGDYLMVLLVLSDPSPLEALRTVLRRLSYLLVPLSVLLVRYFPEIGKVYSEWTGAAEYIGATTSKNMLGAVCLISGVFFFWDTATRWSDRREKRTKRIILVNASFVAMALWLLHISDSQTSLVCLVIGCSVIIMAHSKFTKRHPTFLKIVIPSSFLLYVILAFGFDINAKLAPTLGRDPNLTNRTEIWKFLLNMHTNPLVGTGFQSFWLGSRLQTVWHGFSHINEAHNGYLDIYLNLGFVGLFLFVTFLIASYLTICKRFRPFTYFASLSLAMWTILVFYNVSEAAFQVGLPWLTFLFVAITISKRADERASGAAKLQEGQRHRTIAQASRRNIDCPEAVMLESYRGQG
jgi:exopolysaccharide production protein ExoQ